MNIITRIRKNPSSIKDIKNPTKVCQVVAVTQDPTALTHIEDPCEEAQLLAVTADWRLFKHIKNPSKKVQLDQHQCHSVSPSQNLPRGRESDCGYLR